ncbi:transposase family protein [Roseivivax jejudonensis]|nr:transposase family protein [Roseivivax jejudonensis]
MDYAVFEGRDVLSITPERHGESTAVTHYRLAVKNEIDGFDVRLFQVNEVRELIQEQRLLVDYDYFTEARRRDREVRSTGELYGATNKVRRDVGRKVFLMERLDRLRLEGLNLTRESVDEFRVSLEVEYEKYQAQVEHGVKKATAQHALRRLPASSTLLEWYRRWRSSGRNPNCFVYNVRKCKNKTLEKRIDEAKIQRIISEWERSPSQTIKAAAKKINNLVLKTNRARRERGRTDLMPERCFRTYENWIKDRSDPFSATMHKKGRGRAIQKFGTSEGGRTVRIPGAEVEFDAWNIHAVVLDVSRERWLTMTEAEREKVPRVRLWLVIAIDVATRVVLGFSVCKNPNAAASLEALRLCFLDKTYLLRAAGLNDSDATWNYSVKMAASVSDSGSEFGREPFGGHLFIAAHRIMGITCATTPTASPSAKPYVETSFRTFDLLGVRNWPGATGSNISDRGDRDPSAQACLTHDEVQELIILHIAEYHNRPHSGLDGITPATAWENATSLPEYDDEAAHCPGRIREACGYKAKATITKYGIRYENNLYVNGDVRDERVRPYGSRSSSRNGEVDIVVDPFDLGAISIVTAKGLIGIPCIDKTMCGKSLRTWRRERMEKKIKSNLDAERRSGVLSGAREAWRSILSIATQRIDVGLSGYSDGEVMLEKNLLWVGKGQHEEPYIGKDEGRDPLANGFRGDLGEDTTRPKRSPRKSSSKAEVKSDPLSRYRRKSSDDGSRGQE